MRLPSYDIRIDDIQSRTDTIPADLRDKPVLELLFSFHLPFLLRSPSPIPEAIDAGDFTCNLVFTHATRDVEYHGGYKRTEEYTIATSSLRMHFCHG